MSKNADKDGIFSGQSAERWYLVGKSWYFDMKTDDTMWERNFGNAAVDKLRIILYNLLLDSSCGYENYRKS